MEIAEFIGFMRQRYRIVNDQEKDTRTTCFTPAFKTIEPKKRVIYVRAA